jgi:hypothetical protein
LVEKLQKQGVGSPDNVAVTFLLIVFQVGVEHGHIWTVFSVVVYGVGETYRPENRLTYTVGIRTDHKYLPVENHSLPEEP